MIANTEVEDSSTSSDESDHPSGVQALILKELKRVNSTPDAVESKVATTKKRKQHKDKEQRKFGPQLSNFVLKNKLCDESQSSCSNVSSSSSEDELPCLLVLKSSRAVQRKIDQTVAEMEAESRNEGNDLTIESKRGCLDVLVQTKVSWPHECILGGITRQRLTYDQLTKSQFVQGFTKKTFWLNPIKKIENIC